jgi:hypothetical protein
MLQALQKPPPSPAQTSKTVPEPKEDEGPVLVCATCRQTITWDSARIAVGGKHEHTFANPHGYAYRIGCFSRATGCFTVGQASTYWTWFPGHSWEIEHCSGCGEHLGWLFRAAEDRFHGLILDHLAERKG